MALVDLKRTKSEKKSEKAITAPGGGEDYPYGTRLRLGDEELDKMGIDELPQVGDGTHIHGHGHVTSVSEDHHEGGKKRRHVEIQIKHLQLKPGERKPGRVDGKHADQADGMKAAMDGALAKGEAKTAAEPDDE